MGMTTSSVAPMAASRQGLGRRKHASKQRLLKQLVCPGLRRPRGCVGQASSSDGSSSETDSSCIDVEPASFGVWSPRGQWMVAPLQLTASGGSRRFECKNAPDALIELDAELVLQVLSYLPAGQRHMAAARSLNRTHRCRVRENRDVWLPLCTDSPWRVHLTAALGRSAAELRRIHSQLLSAVSSAKNGTVHDVSETMTNYRDVAGVQQLCLEQLVQLLHCEKKRTMALSTVVTARVVDALHLYVQDADLQSVALHCVVFLARPIGGAEGMVFQRGMASTGIDAFLDGGIQAVLASMDKHSRREDVQAMGCWSLVNLALNRQQKLMLLSHNAIDRVLDAMKTHPQALEVQFRALFALINLVIPESSAARSGVGLFSDSNATNHGVINAVLVAMSTFPVSEKLVRCGCLVLHNLSLRDCNIPYLMTAGVVDPLLRAARTHKDVDVQRSAASTLRRLGVTPPPLNFVNPGGGPAHQHAATNTTL